MGKNIWHDLIVMDFLMKFPIICGKAIQAYNMKKCVLARFTIAKIVMIEALI